MSDTRGETPERVVVGADDTARDGEVARAENPEGLSGLVVRFVK
jgi:hypothetical protein